MRQAITVAVDGQELAGVHSLQWETKRKEITQQGALGVANNTGLVGLRLNGHTAAQLWIHEDAMGHVVIDVLNHKNQVVARLEPELYGQVPPRTGSKEPRRERRFGDDFPGAQR